MTTIVEPQKHITDLWSVPIVRDSEVFRLMHYVMRVDCDGMVLLLNTVTGQVVVLDYAEAELLGQLPLRYTSIMSELVCGRYLVPDQFDEHQQVFGMRTVLRKIDALQRKNSAITSYTILPTTACNARCYYCFEQGSKVMTMTEQTAKDVVNFICSHCGDEKKVKIFWFGGEPTVASNRIDQICTGLQTNDIDYQSTMTTNAYLFDEALVNRAASLWHLKLVNISVDGTEQNYNRIKAYVSVNDNPYQRVLHNIGLLLNKGIWVSLRMNFDVDNYHDFPKLLEEVVELYKGNPLLGVHVHPVNGVYADSSGAIHHGSPEWFENKIVELNNLARDAGVFQMTGELPCLSFEGCGASRDSTVTITPQGMLVRCPEQFDEDQYTGSVKEGITHPERVQSWKLFAEYEKCRECIFYPDCERLINCSAKDRCGFFLESTYLYEEAIKQALKASKQNGLLKRVGN